MANTQLEMIAIACLFLIAGIIGVATSSIATGCFEKHPEYKDQKKDNFTFIIVNLVSNILFILISLVSLYSAVVDKDSRR